MGARWRARVFGRTPVAFPNLFLPAWQIEGYASYEESAITGTGRLYAGDFLGLVREAARSGAFEPVDRLNGGLTDWPGGLAPYAYGLGFHAYLAERFGADKLADARQVHCGSGPVHRVAALRSNLRRTDRRPLAGLRRRAPCRPRLPSQTTRRG